MLVNIGATAITAAYIGTTKASAIYLGATQVWSAFTPMGMNKNGSMTLPNSMTKLTGWLADLTGFPGSVMSPDGTLVISGAGTATITAHVAGGKGNLAGTHNYRVYVNGAPVGDIATKTGNNPSSYTLDWIVTGNLSNGDKVELWGERTSVAGSSTVQDGTYLHVELA